jgi:hypothetical protein
LLKYGDAYPGDIEAPVVAQVLIPVVATLEEQGLM